MPNLFNFTPDECKTCENFSKETGLCKDSPEFVYKLSQKPKFCATCKHLYNCPEDKGIECKYTPLPLEDFLYVIAEYVKEVKADKNSIATFIEEIASSIKDKKTSDNIKSLISQLLEGKN